METRLARYHNLSLTFKIISPIAKLEEGAKRGKTIVKRVLLDLLVSADDDPFHLCGDTTVQSQDRISYIVKNKYIYIYI